MRITVYIANGRELIQIYEVTCWTTEDFDKAIQNISPEQFYLIRRF